MPKCETEEAFINFELSEKSKIIRLLAKFILGRGLEQSDYSVERTDYMVERGDQRMERSGLERSGHGTK